MKLPENITEQSRRTFGVYVQKFKVKHNNIKLLADKCGVNRQTITRHVEGLRTMSLPLYDKVAKYINENPL